MRAVSPVHDALLRSAEFLVSGFAKPSVNDVVVSEIVLELSSRPDIRLLDQHETLDGDERLQQGRAGSAPDLVSVARPGAKNG